MDTQGRQFSVFTQRVLAVARLSEEHLRHSQLLTTTPTVDFHLPGSSSVTCLIAPQPVLKWARPTHFQWQVFAGPFWFARTKIESDCLKDWASGIEGISFQRIFMAKEVEGSLDLAKLQLKRGITAVNCLKARMLQYNCSQTGCSLAAAKWSLLPPATDYCPASLTGG